MSGVLAITKLHTNKRETTFGVPLYITGMVALISVLIGLLFWRSGSQPGSPEWVEGARMNPGMAYALAGFLGYQGVQSVATTFPFAMTLGATRRSFTLGTVLWWAGMSAYLTVIFVVLCALELATGHWFLGFHIFDVAVLGGGDLVRLAAIVFLGSLSVLSVGGVFAAAWARFGSRGPQLLALGIVVVALVALVVALPSIGRLAEAFQPWWLALAALAMVSASAAGAWALLRSASVR